MLTKYEAKLKDTRDERAFLIDKGSQELIGVKRSLAEYEVSLGP